MTRAFRLARTLAITSLALTYVLTRSNHSPWTVLAIGLSGAGLAVCVAFVAVGRSGGRWWA